MFKFAHIADCHIGANRDPTLRGLELSAFRAAIDRCIEEEVNFILISGDLFHVNVPDMGVANEAVKKLREAKEAGIEIYAIYGSHDYSPNETSMIDVLDSAGLIRKVTKGRMVEGKLRLEFITDPGTGAKLAGLFARKRGIERDFFELLDRDSIEREKGFKVFAFHSAITELKPSYLARMDSIPLSLLPRGFDYYAGGHIHQHLLIRMPGYGTIGYPGALFAGYSRDLELSARGEKRGFYIVCFEEGVKDIKFVEIPVCQYVYVEYDANGKNSAEAQRELLKRLAELDVEGKLVVLRIKGELSGGKTSDINSARIRSLLIEEKGALYVSINRFALTSKEYVSMRVSGEDASTIENRLFRENVGAVKVSNSALKGEAGTNLAMELLKALRQPQKLNEAKKDYEDRILRETIDILQLKEVLG
ncbi:MAG: exonuclease SbcCD subunit D [Thaumarchaeota archaeon]|nr:exonuclease SbcCD subunit D [Nitrososphaerota archaeon]